MSKVTTEFAQYCTLSLDRRLRIIERVLPCENKSLLWAPETLERIVRCRLQKKELADDVVLVDVFEDLPQGKGLDYP